MGRRLDPEEAKRRKRERAEARKLKRQAERRKGGAEAPSSSRKSRSSSAEPRGPFVKDPHDWLRRSISMAFAQKIFNRHPERPYWLSIPHPEGTGINPVAHFYPCTEFRTARRAYYGFLFREHRDLLHKEWQNSRKELTDTIQSIHPQLIK